MKTHRELLDVVDRLVEALRFYGNKYTWLREPDADIAMRIVAEDTEEVKGYAGFCGGKRARQALAEVEDKLRAALKLWGDE